MTPRDLDIQQRVTRAIENGFPTALVSMVAEHESWRKEIYRPLSYIHKWWARRLGSVFRAMIIAGCVDDQQDVTNLLWSPVAFPDTIVYDPFMGSGVTIHEAVKLGCRVIGRDINPVAYTMVRTALQPYDRAAVVAAYEHLAQKIAPAIRALYACALPDGTPAEGLYYFWVKIIPCPVCERSIDLFKSRVFAKHAYPKQYPASQALCPYCDAVNIVSYDATKATCQRCATSYNPQQGVFAGARVACPQCRTTFTLIDAVRRRGAPLDHRMYAKMALDSQGEKYFLSIDEDDRARYRAAKERLPALWRHIPQEAIEPGYNTDQARNYGYRFWHQMFNARQLVALALLSDAIAGIPDRSVRALLSCLFSGALEFNNMFASFKGIGTGAVRHMFSHHILKPELAPLEANLWGTEQSSGAFSTLFESRILRALDYKEHPFELRVITNGQGKPTNEKIYDLSQSIGVEPASSFEAFAAGAQIYLAVGDSGDTDIADETVDLVVTDPPFFDNVHYSQLADFFHVWLRRLLPDEPALTLASTRSPREVQQTDAGSFAERLGGVFAECHRVLKDTGLLIFTYHHTRTEGWVALHVAIRRAGFVVVKTHAIKAEMMVSVSVQQATVPVSFDLIIVCRKAAGDGVGEPTSGLAIDDAVAEARAAAQTLRTGGLDLTAGDAKVILMGCILARLGAMDDIDREITLLQRREGQIDTLARAIIDGVSLQEQRLSDK